MVFSSLQNDLYAKKSEGILQLSRRTETCTRKAWVRSGRLARSLKEQLNGDLPELAELEYVKKNYSESFTNEICEIESGRQGYAACQSSDEHLNGSKTAHTYCLCAAFQPPKGPIFVSERLTYAYKEAPHEKKSLSFFSCGYIFFSLRMLPKNMNKR